MEIYVDVSLYESPPATLGNPLIFLFNAFSRRMDVWIGKVGEGFYGAIIMLFRDGNNTYIVKLGLGSMWSEWQVEDAEWITQTILYAADNNMLPEAVDKEWVEDLRNAHGVNLWKYL